MLPRYNHPILYMRAQSSRGLRLGWLASILLITIFLPSTLHASAIGDAARQLAKKIATESGPGAIALNLANRSSLDEKSVAEVRSALETELRANGVTTVAPDQSMGIVTVVLSENLHEYVWTAEIAIGFDDKKIAMVSFPRPTTSGQFSSSQPVTVKAIFLISLEQPILDAAIIDMPSGARLLVLTSSVVAIYHHPTLDTSSRWELETSLPITHTRAFPRDLRGRLFLRRDHLFDVYLPGTFCQSTSTAPLALNCTNSDNPWPLTPDDSSLRAFFTPTRNFFTGAISPAIGKVTNAPPFYSAAAIPRQGYALWAFASVDGSLHLVDGMTDQVIRGAKWGSDLAAVRSSCGTGTQLLATDSGAPERDNIRAYEIPDRDPVAVSSPLEFDGRITALWSDNSGSNAMAIVQHKDTGFYEAYRVSISCN
jgi:hypothetical protein